MSARNVLAGLCVGRLLFGLWMVLSPRTIGERWLGRGGASAESAALMRVAGIRDAAFAVGGLVAARSGADPRPWLAAGVVIDSTDAYSTITAEGVPATNKAPAVAVALGAAIGSAVAIAAAEDD